MTKATIFCLVVLLAFQSSVWAGQLDDLFTLFCSGDELLGKAMACLESLPQAAKDDQKACIKEVSPDTEDVKAFIPKACDKSNGVAAKYMDCAIKKHEHFQVKGTGEDLKTALDSITCMHKLVHS